MKAFSWPVTLLGGEEGRRSKKRMAMMRMMTQVGRLEDYERAGGVEGVLAS